MMPISNVGAGNKQIYYRLIALWAVCEGMLGGILHGFKLPITGLTVGSGAVIIICLIGYYVPAKGSIIKATIIVAIFKLMLSPQSPLPAYFAVFFQGITGELFFSIMRLLRTPTANTQTTDKLYKISCIVFAAIALFESGVQRIAIMTIIYGTDFWKAVNDFINGLTRQQSVTNYSMYLAGGYVLAHLAAGIFVGLIAGRIPAKVKVWRSQFLLEVSPVSEQPMAIKKELLTGKAPAAARGGNIRHGKKWKRGLLLVWIILLALWAQSEFGIGEPLVSSNLALNILFRSVLVVLTWYFLISPLITILLKQWLENQQVKSQSTINEILLLLPSTQLLFEKSWQTSANEKGLRRLNKFLKTVLVNSLAGVTLVHYADYRDLRS